MAEHRERPGSAPTGAREPEAERVVNAAVLEALYSDEQKADQADATRLIALRELGLERSLTFEESQERAYLTERRQDREPRLQRLQRDVTLAQGEIDLVAVEQQWPALMAQKHQAYEQLERKIQELRGAWEAVLAVHRQQEEIWQALPQSGQNPVRFPSRFELAQWVTSRMDASWAGVLNSIRPETWGIDWISVKDVDPGTRALNSNLLARMQRESAEWRQRWNV